MVYSEWLRIRNTLRGYSWVLLALFIIAIIVRISLNSQFDLRHYASEANAPGAHSTVRTLADGSRETTIDNPSKHLHIVVDDAGWRGADVTVTTTGQSQGSNDQENFSGAFRISQSQKNGESIDEIDTRIPPINLGVLFLIALLPAMIIATCLGAPLARENTSHLEVAFTRPVPRLTLAANIVLADLIGILGSFVMSIITILACLAVYQLPSLTLDGEGISFIVVAVLGAFSWYAMYLAASSMLKRGRGAVLGLAWPIGIFAPGLAIIPLGSSGIGEVAHAIFYGIARIDPIAYINLNVHDHPVSNSMSLGVFGLGYEGTAIALAILTVAYLAAGLAQWQRVEA